MGVRVMTPSEFSCAPVEQTLSPADPLLHSMLSRLQLDQAEQVQAWLAALPANLQALAAQASSQAAQLQQAHGFSLQGLEQLVPEGERGSGAVGLPAPAPPPAASGGIRPALSAGLLLAAPARSPDEQQLEQQGEQRRRYAAEVLRRFDAKLSGQHGSGGQSSEAAAASVEAEVRRLIGEATDSGRLARMYEGWMFWV